MTYRGRVTENGLIALELGASLPEGLEVEVRPVSEDEIPTLADRFKDIIGIVHGLPSDSSINHDHYLYGTPRK